MATRELGVEEAEEVRVRRCRADGQPLAVDREAVQLGDRRDVDAQVWRPEGDALRRLAVHADRRVADDQLDVVDRTVLAQDPQKLLEGDGAEPHVAVVLDAQCRRRPEADRHHHRFGRGDGWFPTGHD